MIGQRTCIARLAGLLLLLAALQASAQPSSHDWCRLSVRDLTGESFQHDGDLIKVIATQAFICPRQAAGTGADISLTISRLIDATGPGGDPGAEKDPKIAIGFETSHHDILIARSSIKARFATRAASPDEIGANFVVAMGIFRESERASKVAELRGLLADHCVRLAAYRRAASRWISLRSLAIRLSDGANRALLSRRAPSTAASLRLLTRMRTELARMIEDAREAAEGAFITLVEQKLALDEKELELVAAVRGTSHDAKAIPIVGFWAETLAGMSIESVYLDPLQGARVSEFTFRVRALVSARPAATPPEFAAFVSFGDGPLLSFVPSPPSGPSPGLEILSSPPIALVDQLTSAGSSGGLVKVQSTVVQEFPDDPATRTQHPGPGPVAGADLALKVDGISCLTLVEVVPGFTIADPADQAIRTANYGVFQTTEPRILLFHPATDKSRRVVHDESENDSDGDESPDEIDETDLSEFFLFNASNLPQVALTLPERHPVTDRLMVLPGANRLRSIVKGLTNLAGVRPGRADETPALFLCYTQQSDVLASPFADDKLDRFEVSAAEPPPDEGLADDGVRPGDSLPEAPPLLSEPLEIPFLSEFLTVFPIPELPAFEARAPDVFVSRRHLILDFGMRTTDIEMSRVLRELALYPVGGIRLVGAIQVVIRDDRKPMDVLLRIESDFPEIPASRDFGIVIHQQPAIGEQLPANVQYDPNMQGFTTPAVAKKQPSQIDFIWRHFLTGTFPAVRLFDSEIAKRKKSVLVGVIDSAFDLDSLPASKLASKGIVFTGDIPVDSARFGVRRQYGLQILDLPTGNKQLAPERPVDLPKKLGDALERQVQGLLSHGTHVAQFIVASGKKTPGPYAILGEKNNIKLVPVRILGKKRGEIIASGGRINSPKSFVRLMGAHFGLAFRIFRAQALTELLSKKEPIKLTHVQQVEPQVAVINISWGLHSKTSKRVEELRPFARILIMSAFKGIIEDAVHRKAGGAKFIFSTRAFRTARGLVTGRGKRGLEPIKTPKALAKFDLTRGIVTTISGGNDGQPIALDAPFQRILPAALAPVRTFDRLQAMAHNAQRILVPEVAMDIVIFNNKMVGPLAVTVGGTEFPSRAKMLLGARELGVARFDWGHEIALAAPGARLGSIGRGGKAELISGTSFASPQVAAVVAFLDKANLADNFKHLTDRGEPYTRMQLLELVIGSTEKVDEPVPGKPRVGFGRLNAWKALLSMLNGGLASNPLLGGKEVFSSLRGLSRKDSQTTWYGFRIRTKDAFSEVDILDGARRSVLTDKGATPLTTGAGGAIRAYQAVPPGNRIATGILKDTKKEEYAYMLRFSVRRNVLAGKGKEVVVRNTFRKDTYRLSLEKILLEQGDRGLDRGNPPKRGVKFSGFVFDIDAKSAEDKGVKED